MFRFVVVLIVVTVNGYASSVGECSWGESYWCSSLENAELCGAFDHCKTTVWKNQILKADDSELCTFCKSFIKDVADFIKDNRTEQDILRFMKNACSVIPNKGVADECSKLVDKFLVQILETIVNDLNPQAICALIRLCTGFEDTVAHSMLPKAAELLQAQPIAKVNPTREATPAKMLASGQIIADSPECTICKFVVGKIDEMLKQNATKQEIIDSLDKICNLLPEAMRDSCMSFVSEYASFIIDMLIQEIDPDLVCSTLRLCSGKPKTTSSKVSDRSGQIIADSPECTICKFVVGKIEEMLKQNATKQEIIDSLDKICSLLPEALRDSCLSFVGEYASFIIDMLIQELDPDLICSTLRLCSGKPKTSSSSKVSGSTECVVCEAIVQYVEALLLENSTLSEIEALVQKVCNFVPKSMKQECDFVVEKYGPFIIQYIATAMTPKSACEHVGACQTQMTGPVKMAVLTESKVIKRSAPLLGASECSWGPKYWCASKENAKKCQATDYCNQTGWDL